MTLLCRCTYACPPPFQPMNSVTLLSVIALFCRWVFALTNHDKAINCWPPTNTKHGSLRGRGLTHLGSERARRTRGLWFWHILPSSAKLDLTRCKETAEKPRACQLPPPAGGSDNWEQLVGSQEQETTMRHISRYKLHEVLLISHLFNSKPLL